jgi:hypothetical protein
VYEFLKSRELTINVPFKKAIPNSLNLQIQQFHKHLKHAQLVQQHNIRARPRLLLLIALHFGPTALRQVQNTTSRLHAGLLLGHVQLVHQFQHDSLVLLGRQLLPAGRQIKALHLIFERLHIVLKLAELGVAVQLGNFVRMRIGVRIDKVQIGKVAAIVGLCALKDSKRVLKQKELDLFGHKPYT